MKIRKILAFLFGTFLIILLLGTYISFKGNPVTQLIATNKMKDYTKKHYPDLVYKFDGTTYNFKDGNYYLHIDVLNSMDQDFSICYDEGNVSDDRVLRVEEKENLSNRIQVELNDEKYEQPAKKIFNEKFDWMVLTLPDEEVRSLENDTSIQQVFHEKKLELIIYLKDVKKMDNDLLEKYRNQLIKEYQDEGINLQLIELNYGAVNKQFILR